MNEATERAIDRFKLLQWIGVTGVLLSALAGMFGFHNASVWRLPVALREQVESKLEEPRFHRVKVEMNGQHVRLRGDVPDAGDVRDATRLAQTAAGPGGLWAGGVTGVDSSSLRIRPAEAVTP